MIPEFNKEGLLPKGIHEASWEEFRERFRWTPERERLMEGLERALESFKKAGCRSVYINGSFVTAKDHPNDYDGCWDETGVDIDKLDPVWLEFKNMRSSQKKKYYGEFFPATMNEISDAKIFLEFFQIDRERGKPKGIIKIDLRSYKL
jgi:RNAse (barnase) inhibitor barstar